MKSSLTLSIPTECKLKTPVRDHFKPTRVTVFEVTDINASVGKHIEELEPSRPAGGDANTEWFGHFSESYTFPYDRTHDFTPRNLPKRHESMCPHKDSYTNVHGGIIRNSQSGNDLSGQQLVNA